MVGTLARASILPECRPGGICFRKTFDFIYDFPFESVQAFVAAIGPINAGSIANLSITYLPFTESHTNLIGLPIQPKLLELNFWKNIPWTLEEYIEARMGTGLRLKLVEDPTGTRARYLGKWRKFVAEANEKLAGKTFAQGKND